MFLLRLIFKTIKLLNSETSARSLASAVMLGMFLGLVPFLTLQCLVVLAIVLFLRVNLTATMVSLGVCKLLAFGLAGTFDALGVLLLEQRSLFGLWAALYHSPLASLRMHHATTLGATLVALVLMVPLFFLTTAGINAYRRTMGERWAKRAALGAGGTSGLRRLYTWIDSPFGRP